jgi:uncharacterized protein (TIGR02596 family)
MRTPAPRIFERGLPAPRSLVASQRRAVTLLELLVVISLLILLMTIIVPAVTHMLHSSQLAQAGQLLSDQLALARQFALAKNLPMEVRFYRFSDPSVIGEQSTPASAGSYRAFQTFKIMESGEAVAQGRVQQLPSSTIIDPSTKLSSLLGSAPPVLSNTFPIPRVGTEYHAVSFRFLSDGSTDLPKTGALWFLTVRLLNDRSNSVPPNYVTVQVDPYNGHIKTFRP